MTSKVKNLPIYERPREKFERYGSAKLDDYELLAILLGSGVKGTNVLELSKKVLKKFKNGTPALNDLESIRGLGKAKAMQILSAFELRDRHHKRPLETLVGPEKVFELCVDIRDSKKEHFAVFYLSSRNSLISREIISVGTLTESLVHPREVFEPALLCGAAKIVLAHNHPSHDPEPSSSDLTITRQLTEAGRLLGVEVVDHIILTKGRFLSFKQRGVL